MSFAVLHRAAAVSALVAIAGCAGSASSPVAQSNASSGTLPLTSQAMRSASSSSASSSTAHRAAILQRFVHRGVPVAPRPDARSLTMTHVSPDYKTKKPLVFEGDQSESAVNLYSDKKIGDNPAPIATIADSGGCPYGMAIDSKKTLYVAGNCGGSTVTEYPKGQTSPGTVITDGISNPLGVTIDPSGNLWVTNYPGDITEYAPGDVADPDDRQRHARRSVRHRLRQER